MEAEACCSLFVRHGRLPLKFDEPGPPRDVIVTTDSDWAGDVESRRSTSGGAVCLGQACTRSWCRTQGCVALNSAEAEYYGMVSGVQEGRLVQQLLEELGYKVGLRLRTDNNAARQAAEKVGSMRQKHMAIRMHFLKEMVKSGLVVVERVSSLDNFTDLLTKPVSRDRVLHCLRAGGCWNLCEEERIAAERVRNVLQHDDDKEQNEHEVLMVEYTPIGGEVSTVRPQQDSTSLWTYTLVVILCGFVLGHCNLAAVQSFCCRRRVRTRTVATQSQTTYHGRFNVLPEALQGAFEEGMRLS